MTSTSITRWANTELSHSKTNQNDVSWGRKVIQAIDIDDCVTVARLMDPKLFPESNINAQTTSLGYEGYLWTVSIHQYLGDTALHFALREKKLYSIYALLFMGANATISNSKQEIPEEMMMSIYGMNVANMRFDAKRCILDHISPTKLKYLPSVFGCANIEEEVWSLIGHGRLLYTELPTKLQPKGLSHFTSVTNKTRKRLSFNQDISQALPNAIHQSTEEILAATKESINQQSMKSSLKQSSSVNQTEDSQSEEKNNQTNNNQPINISNYLPNNILEQNSTIITNTNPEITRETSINNPLPLSSPNQTKPKKKVSIVINNETNNNKTTTPKNNNSTSNGTWTQNNIQDILQLILKQKYYRYIKTSLQHDPNKSNLAFMHNLSLLEHCTIDSGINTSMIQSLELEQEMLFHRETLLKHMNKQMSQRSPNKSQTNINKQQPEQLIDPFNPHVSQNLQSILAGLDNWNGLFQYIRQQLIHDEANKPIKPTEQLQDQNMIDPTIKYMIHDPILRQSLQPNELLMKLQQEQTQQEGDLQDSLASSPFKYIPVSTSTKYHQTNPFLQSTSSVNNNDNTLNQQHIPQKQQGKIPIVPLITELSIQHNLKYMKLGDENMLLLSRVLWEDDVIQQIILSHSRLTDLSISYFAEITMPSMKVLEYVDLSFNALTDESFYALSRGLSSCPMIRRLSLAGNRGQFDGLFSLIQTVIDLSIHNDEDESQSHGLTWLNIRNNACDQADKEALMKYLEEYSYDLECHYLTKRKKHYSHYDLPHQMTQIDYIKCIPPPSTHQHTEHEEQLSHSHSPQQNTLGPSITRTQSFIPFGYLASSQDNFDRKSNLEKQPSLDYVSPSKKHPTSSSKRGSEYFSLPQLDVEHPEEGNEADGGSIQRESSFVSLAEAANNSFTKDDNHSKQSSDHPIRESETIRVHNPLPYFIL